MPGAPRNGAANGPEGHRLFFMAAPAFGLLAMSVWLAGLIGLGPGPVIDAHWHGHSLLLGYGGATLMGFLLLTRRGDVVTAIFAVWALVRLADLVRGSGLSAVVGPVDAGLLVAAVLAQKPVPWRWRRPALLPVAASVAALALAAVSLAYGLGLRALASPAAALVLAGLLAVVGGRLVPGYIRAYLRRGRGLGLMSSERVTVAASIIAPATWLVGLPAGAAASMAGLAVVQLYRLTRWFDRGLLAAPFLLGLLGAFAWLGVGAGLWSAGVLAEAPTWQVAGQHVWLVGTLGPLTVGVAARLAAGRAGWRGRVPAASALAVWSLHGAAAVRGLAAFFPGATMWSLAALAWAAGMAAALVGQARIAGTQPAG